MRYLMSVVVLLVAGHVSAQHFEKIPDFKAAYPPDRVVFVGQNETLSMPGGDIDLLWIEGTCVAPRQGDLALTVREIVVAPGGRLDMGTQADPILGSVTVTFADGEFTPDDPTQWGHGLLVFGDFTCWGAPKASWVELGGNIEGANIGSRSGWNSGDRIRLPDTRPVGGYTQQPRQSQDYLFDNGELDSAPVSGATGNGVVGPIAANMTCSVTFNSENSDGTRGHSIYTDQANVSIGNTAFLGMGRTKPEPLSATNLIGRYPVHFHHSMGSNRSLHDVVVDGLDYKSKWGIVLHASSWVHVERCVCTRLGGAGIVTEDGSEVGNKILNCLCFDCFAGVRKFPADVVEGFMGSGFWLKSMVQFFEGNVGMNCRHGIQSAITAENASKGTPDTVPKLQYQVSPGGPMTGNVTEFQTTLSFKNNRFVCNREAGYDAWGSKCDSQFSNYPPYRRMEVVPIHMEDCIFAYNGGGQVQHSFTDSTTLFTRCQFIGNSPDETSGYGNRSLVGYSRVMYYDQCDFSQCKVGIQLGKGGIVSQCIFDTAIGLEYSWETGALGWAYGLSDDNNQYTGQELVVVGTTPDVAALIEEHPLTMADVYKIIDDYRKGIGGGDPPDPNDAERERLLAEIAAAEQQIVTLTALIADLKAQLDAL